MTTTITRPNIARRLRLVSAEEAKEIGISEAQRLLAETFPADEIRVQPTYM